MGTNNGTKGPAPRTFGKAQRAANSELEARAKHADGRTGVIRGNEVVVDSGEREPMSSEWAVVWGWR